MHVAKHFCSLSGQDIELTWKVSTIVMAENRSRDGSYLHRQGKTRAQGVMKRGRAVWKGLDTLSLLRAVCTSVENRN